MMRLTVKTTVGAKHAMFPRGSFFVISLFCSCFASASLVLVCLAFRGAKIYGSAFFFITLVFFFIFSCSSFGLCLSFSCSSDKGDLVHIGLPMSC